MSSITPKNCFKGYPFLLYTVTSHGHYNGYCEQRVEAEQDRLPCDSGVCGYLRPMGIDLSGDSDRGAAGTPVLCCGDPILHCRRFALHSDALFWPPSSHAQRVGQPDADWLLDVRGHLWRGFLGRAVRAIGVHVGAGGDFADHYHRARGLYLSPAALSLESSDHHPGRLCGCAAVAATQSPARGHPALRRYPRRRHGMVAGRGAHALPGASQVQRHYRWGGDVVGRRDPCWCSQR